VIEVVEGLEEVDRLKASKRSITQDKAFLEIFGVKCIRQTLSTKRKLLSKVKLTQQHVLDKYMEMGHSRKAKWSGFEAELKGESVSSDSESDDNNLSVCIPSPLYA
jgi:hypothetical protein